tara:strand:+ start:96 stop:569 length:474 start_codon:yes stop_codon:yes gene_type:complete
MSEKLIFVRTNIIGTLTKKRIYDFFDRLENWTVKYNHSQQDMRITISPFNEEPKIVRHRHISSWKEGPLATGGSGKLPEFLKDNVDDEGYTFEYQARYKLSIFEPKIIFEKREHPPRGIFLYEEIYDDLWGENIQDVSKRSLTSVYDRNRPTEEDYK